MAFRKMMLVIAIFLALTSVCYAFNVDGDDTYYVSGGESIEGAFIISETTGDYLIKTDFAWISFENDRYINSKMVSKGDYVSENAFLVKYYITIPENVDVNVHRTYISVSDGKTNKYVNVKISVQKSIFRAILEVLNKPNSWIYVVFCLSLLLIILSLVHFPRQKGGRY